MAGKENLVSLGDRTTEEQHEIATKGGIASGVARNKKKMLRFYLIWLKFKMNVPKFLK